MRASAGRAIRSVVLTALAGAVLLPGQARAQDPGPFVVGSRVRVQAPADLQGPVEGMVMELDESTVLLSADGRVPIRISRDAITQLEVATGRKRQPIKGALIGAGIGAGINALVSHDLYCSELEPGQTCPSKARMVATGAAGGALWGAFIGLLVKSDRWGSVPLDRVHVGVAPVRGHGVGLTLSTSW